MHEGGTAADRRSAAQHMLAECDAEITMLSEHKDENELRYALRYERETGEQPPRREPVRLDGHEEVAFATEVGALVLLGGEVLLGWYLFILLGFGVLVALLLALLVAMITALGIKAVMRARTARDEERPRAAAARLRTALLVAGIPALAAFGVAIWVRGDPDPARATVFMAALTVLGVTLPLLAGILWTISRHYGWSGRLVREAREIRSDLAGVERLREAAQGRLAHPVPAAEAHPGLHTAAALVGGLGLSVLLAAGAHAQRGSLSVDGTLSVDSLRRVAAVDAALAELPRLTARRRLVGWDIVTFGEDAWSVLPASFPWPQPTTVACARTPENELTKLIPRAAQLQRARDEEGCRSEQVRVRAANTRAAAQVVGRIRARALARPAARRCTAVWDLLARLSRSVLAGDLAIAITDASDTCGGAPTEILPTPAGTVVVVLVTGETPQGSSEGGLFRARERALREKAPWALVVAPWQLRGIR